MSFQPNFVRIWCLCAASMLLVSNALAQQNLFNIPSGSITPKKEFFFQQQVNVYDWANWAAKSHVVYGLGSGWELGMNVIDVNLNFERGIRGGFIDQNTTNAERPFKPTVLLTAQKQVRMGDKWAANLGTQTGLNVIAPGAQSELSYFHYALAVWQPKHHTRLVAGPYLSNQYLLGAGNTVGYLVGFEYPLTNKLLLMGDYVSGTNAQSTGVLGVNYYLTKRVQLCLGGLVPSPGSPNKAGVVFELNLLSYDEE